MTLRHCLLGLALSAATLAIAQQGPSTSSKPYPTDTRLAATIQKLLADPAAPRAHWGIAVTQLDGTPIYGSDEAKLFRPASTAKLFTTAAAMALLKPDATVSTIVRGEVDNAGVVGILYLEGGGDANLDSNDLPYVPPALRSKDVARPDGFRDLESLADQLVAKGVKRISGKIVANDGNSFWNPYPQGWEEDDLVWGYAAPVTGLTIADNQIKLIIVPGVSQRTNPGLYYAPSGQLEQNGVAYYTLKSEGLTEQKKEYWSGVGVDRKPGARALRIHGFMAADSKPDVEEVAIDDPTLYAAMAFRNVLIKKGIEVVGEATADHSEQNRADSFVSQLHDPGSCANPIYGMDFFEQVCSIDRLESLIPVLASHTSPALADDVKYTLKASQNLHAELMLRHLGSYSLDDDESTVGGARVVRQWLLHDGIADGDFLFYDGSGLSTKDLVTPRAEAQLLAYAAKQPWFAQWKVGLPVGGVDGTLAGRFKDPPLKGHVFAKTGTLGESRALAGYLDCASGKQVIFSILEDDHLPGGSADKDVMDRIVAAIAAAE